MNKYIIKIIVGIYILFTSYSAYAFERAVFIGDNIFDIKQNTVIIDSDDSGGDTKLQFGNTLNEFLSWDHINSRFVFSNALRVEGNLGIIGETFIANNHDVAHSDGILNIGKKNNTFENLRWDEASDAFIVSDNIKIEAQSGALSLGTGDAQDVTIEFSSSEKHILGWDENLQSFSSFGDQIAFQVLRGGNPPEGCSANVEGMLWMDEDSGFLYTCVTADGKNKWLSSHEQVLHGGGGNCGHGQNTLTSDECRIGEDRFLGGGIAQGGMFIPRDITITGYGFSASDDDCAGSFDLEVFGTSSASDDDSYILLENLDSGLTGDVHNKTDINIDIDGEQHVIFGMDNNCGILTSYDDWGLSIFYRWRHD